jgi:hypothetical protein
MMRSILIIDRWLKSNKKNISSLLFQKHLLCNAAHISSTIREHFYMNETFSQMKSEEIILLKWIPKIYSYRLAWRMKAFPSNVSVTILNRRQYDKQLSNDLNKVLKFFLLTLIYCIFKGMEWFTRISSYAIISSSNSTSSNRFNW